MTYDALLSALQPLTRTPKPLIFWHVPSAEWHLPGHPMQPLIRELARIGGRLTVDVGIAQRTDGTEIFAACMESAISVDAKVSLSYQPYYGEPIGTGDPTNTLLVDEQVSEFKGYLNIAQPLFSDGLATEVLLDNEHFVKKSWDASWNTALTSTHNKFYHAGKDVFPSATHSLWESHCCTPQPQNVSNPWPWKQWTTWEETRDGLDMTLSCLPDESGMRGAVERVAGRFAGPMMCWLDLGAGYRAPPGGSFYRDKAWDYDPVYAWRMGQWLGWHPRVTRLGSIVPPQEDTEHPSWTHAIACVQGMLGVIP